MNTTGVGEGEFKVYLDGDREFPTIAGTGSEDYVGLSFGIQQTPFRYHGTNFVGNDRDERQYMYRWHLPDPIFWQQDIRVTIQQIGCCSQPLSTLDMDKAQEWYSNSLFERQDDWSAATFWYEAVPSELLPPLADVAARTADFPAPGSP